MFTIIKRDYAHSAISTEVMESKSKALAKAIVAVNSNKYSAVEVRGTQSEKAVFSWVDFM